MVCYVSDLAKPGLRLASDLTRQALGQVWDSTTSLPQRHTKRDNLFPERPASSRPSSFQENKISLNKDNIFPIFVPISVQIQSILCPCSSKLSNTGSLAELNERCSCARLPLARLCMSCLLPHVQLGTSLISLMDCLVQVPLLR